MIKKLLLTFFSLALLAGCQMFAFSPEQAAMQAVLNNQGHNTSIDSNSLQVLQTQELGEMTLVHMRYKGMDARMGETFCDAMYAVKKSKLGGWSPTSGGGGCSNQRPDDPNQPPVSMGGNRSSGNGPNEPGHTVLSGLVNQEDIKSIQITWIDGTVQQTDVVNGSYLAGRIGQFAWSKIEGLDADDQVVYTAESPEPAEGKK